jgi:hypothetical protein
MKFCRSLFFFILIILSCSGALFATNFSFAANKNLLVENSFQRDSILPKSTSEYFDDYSNRFSLFLYAKEKYNSFSIYDPVSNKLLSYTPNKQLNMGLGFHYKWMGIGIALNFGFINHDDNIYGDTKRIDLQTNIYMNKAVFDFYLQYYKNFYIENPKDAFSGWTGGNKPYVRPDIGTLTMGLSGLYVFNHKHFSYKAAFVQTAIQKKNAGSFMLGGSAFLQGIVGDSSLLPMSSDFNRLPQVNAHSGFYFGVIVAYAYSFTIRKYFYISLSLLSTVEVGEIVNKFESGTVSSAWVPIIHIQPRMSVGYNRPKWYMGFSFVRDSYFEGNKEEDDLEFSFSSGNFRLYTGMRFNWFSGNAKKLKN